jgi:hypothetical protein
MIHLFAAILALFLTPALAMGMWDYIGFGKWGLIAIWIGELSNITAVIANGWQMPVIGYFIYPETLWKTGDPKSFLPWLCDRFPLPHVGICSIGDFIVFLGVAIVIAWAVSYIWRR